MIDITKGNNSQESFKQFEGLGLSSGYFQFSNLLQLLNKHLGKDSNVLIFDKVNKGRLQMVNVNY